MGLKRLDGGFRDLVIAAGDLGVIKAQLGQTGLKLRDQLAGVAVFDRLFEGEIVCRFGFGGRRGRFGKRGRRRGHKEAFVEFFFGLLAGGDKLNVAVVAQNDLPRVILPEDFFAQAAGGDEQEQTEQKREMFHESLREMVSVSS